MQQVIHIDKGNGSVRSYRANGRLMMSGEVKDRKLVFPWLVFNDLGEPIDTIKTLVYDEKVVDYEAFAKMIDDAFNYAKVLYENYQIHEKNPKKQTEEEEVIIIEVPAIDFNDMEEEKEPIFDYPEIDAQFPGGVDAMFDFLNKNIKYPEKALENRDQGRVFVKFVVKKDGSCENVKIIRGVSKEIDEEAKRVIRLMPDWIPAQVKGEIVNSSVRIPINFKL